MVQDTFLGQLSEVANLVLPRATFAETNGTYTSLERRIQRVKPSIKSQSSGALSEQWFLSELAGRMGFNGFDYPAEDAIMDEIASVSPIYSGVSYALLESQVSTVYRSDLENPKPTQLL